MERAFNGLRLLLLSLALSSLLIMAGCSNSIDQSEKFDSEKNSVSIAQTEITVSAAASLKDALDEIKPIFDKANPGIKLTLNFGSSGALQQQIEHGAPVDVFISAALKQIDALADKGFIISETRRDLLGNDLVLITGINNSKITDFGSLTKDHLINIAIGNPETVPAGSYAQESLSHQGIFNSLQNKLVLAKDVRQVLTYVENGNAEAGIVYNSDVQSSKAVKIVAKAPENSHSPIVYPIAILKATKELEAAKTFCDFLKSEEAKEVFVGHGFRTK